MTIAENRRVSNECTVPSEASRFVRFQLEELVAADRGLADLDEPARLTICDLLGGLRRLGMADREIAWQLRYADVRSLQDIIDDGLREEDHGALRLDAVLFFSLDRVVEYLERVGPARAKVVCGVALRIAHRTPPA